MRNATRGRTDCLILILLSSMSLMSIAQTTEEEYEFCVHGMKVLPGNGVTPAAGYTVERGYSTTIGQMTMSVSYLVRGDGSTAAAVLTHRYAAGYTLHFCIPDRRSEFDMQDRARVAYHAVFMQGSALWGGDKVAEFEFLYNLLQRSVGECRIH